MNILTNGHAGEMSEAIRVYRPDKSSSSLSVVGNFSGATVKIEQSLDAKNWFTVEGADSITEDFFGFYTSINGWIRATIIGGTPFQSESKQLIIWRPNTYYEKGVEVHDVNNNRYLRCLVSHLDPVIPLIEYWESFDYSPEQKDNSNATNISVAIS